MRAKKIGTMNSWPYGRIATGVVKAKDPEKVTFNAQLTAGCVVIGHTATPLNV